MGEREELNREHSLWTIKKQEAENRLRAIEPKAVDVSGLKEPEHFTLTTEKLAEIENVQKEIKEAGAKIKEIRQKIKNLPPSKQ